MINLNYGMDHILYQDIQDYFKYIIEKHETVVDNPPIRIYVIKQKIELHSKLKQGIISNF